MKKDKRVVFQIGLREWYKYVYIHFDPYRECIKEMINDLRTALDENI